MVLIPGTVNSVTKPKSQSLLFAFLRFEFTVALSHCRFGFLLLRSHSNPNLPFGSQFGPKLENKHIAAMSNLILLPAFLTLALISLVNSMRFELESGHTKCISEDIKSNAMTVGKYSVVNPNEGYPIPDTHRVTVKVSSPHGNSYHYGDHVDSGNFAFTASEAGDYTACFWIPDSSAAPSTVTVEFDWRTGVAAKDWSKVAKKGQIEVMELELKKLYDTVTSIHDEMFYLREREEEMQDLNKATNSKMFTFSFLSIVVCLSVAGLQLWHLKTFFERKKLL